MNGLKILVCWISDVTKSGEDRLPTCCVFSFLQAVLLTVGSKDGDTATEVDVDVRLSSRCETCV